MIAACISTAVFANALAAEAELSAAEIVEKNVAARGGLEAWRKIQSMVWFGHIERANAADSGLPYVLEQKRPNKTRFEIKSQNQVGTRIYDGTHGWKLRPASNGRIDQKPYTAEELSYARDGQGIDGALVDYQAKGITVTLDGVDEVEGCKAYRLSVKLPSGASHHVWIDAQNFLDIKYDRQIRNAQPRNGQSGNAKPSNSVGRLGTVTVFYRDFKTIDGLQIPLLIESGSDTAKETDKMVIDKISLNPLLDDQRFSQPKLPAGGNAVSFDSVSPREFRPTPPSSWLHEFPRLNSRHLSDHTGTQ